MIEAKYWEPVAEKNEVQCLLCPNACVIARGKTGLCRVRCNIDGKLFTVIGDYCCSAHMDPIEKKPLYHFHPGSKILSLGTFGCNFSCVFCQNWTLSHVDSQYLKPENIGSAADHITPADVLGLLEKHKASGNIGIAYTYNEPSIWYEFVLETAKLIHEHGFVNVLVSNGYLSEKPLRELMPFIDAVNIDIKSINPEFYVKFCKSRLQPVLEYCKIIKEQALLEITNLVIPTLNDSEHDLQGLVSWVSDNLGDTTPIHFSAYHPDFKLDIPPTPVKTLERAYEIASKKLKYVYVGNVSKDKWNNTHCPSCGKEVITRVGMGVESCSLKEGNLCASCNKHVDIVGNCRHSW